MKLPLTIACWDYDRTRTLFDGRTPIEGVDANLLNLPVEETFFRALRSQEFDVAELSMSSYTLQRSRGTCAYTAIPVFLSRMFRHSGIYIRTDRGIHEPKDLVGRVVGVPEYQLTAPVWVRGLLAQEYGVKPSDLQWRTGGIETPGRHEKVALSIPGVQIQPIPADETLNQWLLDGRIDAFVSPRAPSCFSEGRPHIGRLFTDLRGAEKAYFGKTGIYPIMHVVGIKNELVERHPWLAASLMKAFSQAKDHALAELHEVGALKTSLPWLVSEVAETVALLGADFWRYGVSGNEKTLDAFLGYHHEQGLSGRRLRIDELFVPSATEQFVI